MSEETVLPAALSSVELSVSAKGQVYGTVKVYSADADAAFEHACHLLDELRKKYPAA